MRIILRTSRVGGTWTWLWAPALPSKSLYFRAMPAPCKDKGDDNLHCEQTKDLSMG